PVARGWWGWAGRFPWCWAATGAAWWCRSARRSRSGAWWACCRARGGGGGRPRAEPAPTYYPTLDDCLSAMSRYKSGPAQCVYIDSRQAYELRVPDSG
ncbi:hypothetical protein, partial [Nocardia brasiliensis]|uniref:hypothetical protein n=1 Tax=Nocardia brasiliensis TaxID=37326 RepID=UPI00245502C3